LVGTGQEWGGAKRVEFSSDYGGSLFCTAHQYGVMSGCSHLLGRWAPLMHWVGLTSQDWVRTRIRAPLRVDEKKPGHPPSSPLDVWSQSGCSTGSAPFHPFFGPVLVHTHIVNTFLCCLIPLLLLAVEALSEQPFWNFNQLLAFDFLLAAMSLSRHANYLGYFMTLKAQQLVLRLTVPV